MRRRRICVLLTALLLVLANAAPGCAWGTQLDWDSYDEDGDGYAEAYGLCLKCCKHASYGWYYKDSYDVDVADPADIGDWARHRPEEHKQVDLSWDGNTLVIPEGVTSLDISTDFNVEGDMHIWDLPPEIRFPSTLETIDCCELLCAGSRDGHSYTGTHLTIPEGVKTLKGFGDLSRRFLRRISLPSTLEELDVSLLQYSQNLEYIRVAEGNPHYKVVDNVLFSGDGKTLLFYPRTKKDAHYDVPAGVETIGDYAFYYNDSIRSISLPFGLKEIGNRGIYACYALTSVSVPVTLEKIGWDCFWLCMNLKQMTLPKTVEGRKDWDDWFNRPALIMQPDMMYDREYYNSRYFEHPDFENGDYSFYRRSALLCPGSDTEKVKVYRKMDDQSEVLFEADSGSLVNVYSADTDADMEASFRSDDDRAYCSDTYYKVGIIRCLDENPPEFLHFRDNQIVDEWCGYVKKDEVVLIDAYPELFDVEKVIPRHMLTASSADMCTYPCSAMADRLPRGTMDTFGPEVYGQWVTCKFYGLAGIVIDGRWSGDELAYGIIDSFYSYGTFLKHILDAEAAHHFWIGDVTLKRAWTEDPAVYGIVVTENYRTHAPLYAQPDAQSECLGLYFSGVHLEVLAQDGAWTQVRMADGRQGYLKGDDVTVVEMEAFE